MHLFLTIKTKLNQIAPFYFDGLSALLSQLRIIFEERLISFRNGNRKLEMLIIGLMLIIQEIQYLICLVKSAENEWNFFCQEWNGDCLNIRVAYLRLQQRVSTWKFWIIQNFLSVCYIIMRRPVGGLLRNVNVCQKL